MSMQFPSDFAWGAATAAYQIEGAVNEGGRGLSIWDEFCRLPGKIANGDSGDIACDHYHRWEEDLDLVQSLGMNSYRFSVSWPRIQPTPDGAVNQEGLDFYGRLIDGMLARGLQPFMTLYHWDLPLYLQQQGGWNARATVDSFVAYAQILGRAFGDRVASIATFNEPFVAAYLGHWAGIHAPGITDPQTSVNVTHHLLLAHGRAVQALRAQRVSAPLGIVLNLGPVYPATDSAADAAVARNTDVLWFRHYLDPLLTGAYPADLGAALAGPSIGMAGLSEAPADDVQAPPALVPPVQPGDLEIIATPLDFLGVNYYSRMYCSAEQPPRTPQGARYTAMGWEVYPQGLTELLVALGRDYPRLPPLYITENGAAYDDVVEDGAVNDGERLDFLRGHLEALGQALAQGVDVRGYFAWSLLDNLEWAMGYSRRFGLCYVDYATQRRIPKQSALWYRDFIARHRLAGPEAAAGAKRP